MIDQKVALITGASRGIGNAIAIQLAREGYAVVAVGTSSEESIKPNLDKIRSFGYPFLYIPCNIAVSKEREEMLQLVLSHFGRLDVLVNNAGVAPKKRMDLLDTTEESLDYVLGINLKGTFFLTQSVAKIMIEETCSIVNHKPIIINISSISAYTSSTQRGEYCISKAGVSMITTLFADRLSEYGILVYEIRPGIIRTDMTSAVQTKYDEMIAKGLTPIKRWGTPEDVAQATSVLCSGLLGFSTGEILNVDGGFHLRRL